MAVIMPVLTTARLELRPPVASDFAANMAIVSHEETARYLAAHKGPADHFARFCRNAGSWMLYGYGAFTVRLRSEKEIIGNCGVFHTLRGLGPDFDDQPEAGWILRHDQVGRGLAREAMEAVLEWFGGEHGGRRIVCMIEPGNEPSIRLAGKLGFTPMREAKLPEGGAVRLFERLPR
ncbi:GNAT family N-acetyltransferase [Croceibacterium selenioxidans]|jgi:RimJ/RimL family protein N-acetyltransferase|nr:GNAT family N-acetyltransferase [Croceibacterium selenioxidans]